MSEITIDRVLSENAALKIQIVELEKLVAQVREERDTAERKLFNANWKLAEADETIETIERIEEGMRRDGYLIDPLKPNWKQQVKLINECERRNLEAN